MTNGLLMGSDPQTGQTGFAAPMGGVLDALSSHVVLIDGSGTIVMANAAWRSFAGANGLQTPEFGVGLNYLDLCDQATGTDSTEAKDAAAGIRELLAGTNREFLLEYPCHSPTQKRWFRLRGVPLTDSPHSGAVLLHINITAAKLTETEAQASEERFRATFEQAAVGLAHVREDGTFLRVNRKLCDMLGYPEGELMQKTFRELTFSDDRDGDQEAVTAMLGGTQSSYRKEMRYLRKNGETLWVELVTTLATPVTGQPNYFISVIEDINNRKLAELRFRRLNKLHAVLSEVGELIVRVTNAAELFESACRIAVEGGLHAALIVMLDPQSGGPSLVVASCGESGCDDGELKNVSRSHSWSVDAAASAVQAGSHFVCNNIENDAWMESWRDEAYPQGCRANASFTLRSGGETVGAFVLCACDPGYFQEDELQLLVAVAADLSLGLDALQQDRQRLASEERLRASEERLRRSEERLQGMFDASRDGILVEKDGVIAYINHSYLEMLGYTEAELVGGRISKLLTPETYERLMDYGRRRVRGEKIPELYEFSLKRSDGTFVEVEGAVSVFVADSTHYITTTVRDITERRKAMDAARASENRFRRFADVTSDAIWEWSLITNQVWRSENFGALSGYSGEEVGSDLEWWASHVVPEDRERVMTGIDVILKGEGNRWSDEYSFVRRDNSLAYIHDRGYVVRDGTGAPIGMMGGMTDISERHAADEKIAQQAALIDDARDAMIVRQLDHTITFWSKGAERLFGWSCEQAIGQSCEQLLHIDENVFASAMRTVLATGAWAGELEKTTATGVVLTLDSRWTLLRDDQGDPKSVLDIDTDITERKAMESQFLRSQRMESVGTLAGGIAHDLNNLLMPIMMGSALLRRFEPTDRSVKVIDNIEQSARRAADLIKQLLSFARGVEGARVGVQLGDIVREVSAIIDNTFPKDIFLETHVTEDVCSISGDPTQISQILLNLCVNARDAMPEGGRLEISVGEVTIDSSNASDHPGVAAGRYVTMSVQDSGSGMSKEVIDRIFEPFFTTKKLGQGTGLGLSTAVGIIRSHGGFMHVSSVPGQGSKFRVYLRPQVEAGGENKSTAALLLSPPRGHGELILIVDDEAGVRSITKETLEAFGYRVLAASTGEEAINLYSVERHRIAMVLTDLMMPGMSGADLILHLREINPDAAVVAVTGLDDTLNRRRAESAGSALVLLKPYTAEVLLETISGVLKRRTSQAIPA